MRSKDYVQTVRALFPDTSQGFQGHIYQLFIDAAQEWTKRDDSQGERLGEIYRTRPKQCFYNCQVIAIAQPQTYTYAEGFANALIPVHHAWLVDREGMVVDPTWTASLGYTLGEADYYGVEIPAPFLSERMFRDGTAKDQMWSFLMEGSAPPEGMPLEAWKRKGGAV